MPLSSTTARTDPDEVARRRALEAYIFRTHWPLLALLVTLALTVRAAPLWLSLVALGGYLLHNLLRLPLITRGTLGQLRRAGRGLFVFDMALLLVGLWPLLRRGSHPVQVMLLLLLLEATYRLRMERRAFAVIGIVTVTLVLILYVVVLGLHACAYRDDVAIWLGGFLAVSSAAVLSHFSRMPIPRLAAVDLPVPAMLVPGPPPGAPPGSSSPPLTPQQRAVLRLIAAGLHTDAIAERLSLSPQTVRSHLRDISQRLGAHTREEAVARARERGELS